MGLTLTEWDEDAEEWITVSDDDEDEAMANAVDATDRIAKIMSNLHDIPNA